MVVAPFPDHPFSWPQARAAGTSRARLRTALRDRRVVRLLRGVYLRADVDATVAVRARAAALVTSPHSVLCDRTAAWIWGVGCHEYRELDDFPPLESCVLRGYDPTDRQGVAGGTRDLKPSDWVEVHGVRVTTPLRTALDLGCKLPRRPALAAMDGLMRAHGFTTADLARALPRYFRRRGAVQLRELVPVVDPRAESAAESWTRLEIIDAGLPVPEPQCWVCIDGVPTYRLDLAYRHARIAIEYDGQEFHSSEADRAADDGRRTWLRQHGWTVVVLDRDSFGAEAIAAWTGELRALLRESQRLPQRRFSRVGR